jgi:hypothetical protein
VGGSYDPNKKLEIRKPSLLDLVVKVMLACEVAVQTEITGRLICLAEQSHINLHVSAVALLLFSFKDNVDSVVFGFIYSSILSIHSAEQKYAA